MQRSATTVFSLLLAIAANAQEEASAQGKNLRQRALAVHRAVLTLDTHKDISPNLAPENLPEDPERRLEFRRRFDPSFRGSQKVDFPKMREGGLDCAFFIVYVGQGRLEGGAYVRAKQQAFAKFDAIHRMARLHPGHVGLATEPDQVRAIWKSGRLVACIGIENGYPMGEDLGLIEEFHRRGARYMGIAHNRHSQLGDSHTPEQPLHGGLSELGRKAVAEMNRVGIMVDISHGSKKTAMDVLAHSQAPVIASHSGCAALCAHGRNLDDETLRALTENGGVIQIVALASFLKDYSARNEVVGDLREELGLPRSRWEMRGREIENLEEKLEKLREQMKDVDGKFPPTTVKDLIDHIDHAVAVAGIDHVGISSDFDGGGGIVGWNDASETFNVTLELVRRGYSEEEVGKLWSGNLLRVWQEVAAHAAGK